MYCDRVTASTSSYPPRTRVHSPDWSLQSHCYYSGAELLSPITVLHLYLPLAKAVARDCSTDKNRPWAHSFCFTPVMHMRKFFLQCTRNSRWLYIYSAPRTDCGVLPLYGSIWRVSLMSYARVASSKTGMTGSCGVPLFQRDPAIPQNDDTPHGQRLHRLW